VPQAPTGTVTFLFSDIVGSTRSWDSQPDAMSESLARHDALMRATIEQHNGFVFATGGDGFAVAFGRAGSAVDCAAEMQRALAEPGLPRVRIGLHTGECEERGGDYFGPTVNRAARLMAIGHGGQVLVSASTAQLASNNALRDLGEHRLKDLSTPEHVYQLGHDDFPPLRSLDVRTTNLPVQLTSFVGRADDVAAVVDLLAHHRLVTLTGVGGVGKTRLALQAAADAVERYPDGVWFVELASVEAARVIDAIARTLRIEVPSGAPVELALLDALRTRAILLLLDNCEHLVREVRRLCESLLREAPALTVLTTSREALRVPGEHVFAVPSLDDNAASTLFVERASAVASLELNDADRESIDELCGRLDGIPLAIELAAARVRMFNVREITTRVEQRFRLLSGGRGSVERHQTLRAAIDWSYELLEPPEQAVFARLSTFAGGATLDAIESVVDDEYAIDVVAELVDKSLVVVDRTNDETRYGMFETIRQYAQEELVDSGEADDVRTRHARFYAEFARSAGRGLYSAQERQWAARLEPEIGNLQVAVAWATATGDTDTALRIAGSFTRLSVSRPLLGTAYLAETALDVAGFDEHPLRARVLGEAAWAAIGRRDLTVGRERLQRAAEAMRNGARFAAAVYTGLLTIAGWEGYSDSVDIAADGLQRAEAAGDVLAEIGMRCAYSSMLTMVTDSHAEARAHAERAIADARRLQQPTLEIGALYALGVSYVRDDPATAIELLRESTHLATVNGNETEQGATNAMIAYLECEMGNVRSSLVAVRRLAEYTISNPMYRFTPFLFGIGGFIAAGRPDLFALCEGNSHRTAAVTEGRIAFTLFEGFHDAELATARAAMHDDERFDALVAEGASYPLTEFCEMMIREIDDLLAKLPADA
jgi:predicted ATPase